MAHAGVVGIKEFLDVTRKERSVGMLGENYHS